MTRLIACSIIGSIVIALAWLTAATLVGGAVATIDGNHGSIAYVIFAWWIGLAAAVVHILLHIVRLARPKG
jgi:hypothetical protein